MNDDLLTPADVEAMTTLTQSTLVRMRRSGEGPRWLRLGRRRIAYRRTDVEAWLSEQAARTG